MTVFPPINRPRKGLRSNLELYDYFHFYCHGATIKFRSQNLDYSSVVPTVYFFKQIFLRESIQLIELA